MADGSAYPGYLGVSASLSGRAWRERPADVLSLNILSNRGRTIRPKTLNQKRYVDAIDKHTVWAWPKPSGPKTRRPS